MFRERCGQANPDEAKFCEGCGANLEPVAAPVVEEASAPAGASVAGVTAAVTGAFDSAVDVVKGNDKLQKIIKIAIPIVAVILVLIILAACGVFTHGSEKALKKLYKAMAKGDGKAIYNLTIDPIELEKAIDSEYNDIDSKEDYIEEFKENAEEELDDLEDEFGNRLKTKVEIKKVTKYKKKEVKELGEYLEEHYDYEAKDLQDIRVLKAKVTIKGSEDDDSDTDEYVVAKIKGKWYVGGVGDLYSKDRIESVLDGDED